MRLGAPHTRMLAIDLRPQRFGYAIFEGPKRLLDWGVAEYRPGGATGAAAAQKSAARLLGIFGLSAVAVRIARRTSTPTSPGVKPILGAIRRVAAAHGALVRIFARNDLRNAFRVHGAKTKHEIASRLAVMFPELLWKLPSKREIYESEASSMTIFDAVALGVTYWRKLAESTSQSRTPSEPFRRPRR